MAGMKSKIEKYVLQNAIFYQGTANPKAVLGKVLGNEPDLRTKAGQVRLEIEKTVLEVNRLSLQEQKGKLSKLDPDMLVKEDKIQEELPPLPNAVKGKVVTRFAPSPTGPLNIAHLLRAAMMNYLYAQKYGGKFLLRLEDTDPGKIEKQYYTAIQDDLKAAGVKWNGLAMESDHMALYHRHARELISGGKSYMCTCPADKFREYKLKKQNCPCRDNNHKVNLADFEKAKKGGYKEGEIVLRFKTSMQDPNPALRDPPLMRVSKKRHPLKGRKFNFWPLYNFANVVSDHEQGVTHVFRGKEHEHNTETQRRISEALGWEKPTTVNFGMIYLPGEKLHTRDIKEGIAKGKYTGWDDPRLHTVKALMRRGFQPEAFRQYAIQVSLTKNDIRMSWDNLESFNRSVIDQLANRYMIVLDPVRIPIKGFPAMSKVEVDLHPDYPERGKRSIPIEGNAIFISRDDWKRFRGKTVRLKNLFNVELGNRTAEYAGDDIVQAMPKLQWVSSINTELILIKPDHEEKAIGEFVMRTLKKGDLLQMERLGYGKVDKKSPLRIMWTHR